MDCEAFDSALLDALYDELSASDAKAMEEHAVVCSACAEKLERLRKTRAAVHGALEVPFPAGLETRILAAAGRAKKTSVIAFLSRPQFAIAATFLLVIGAALFMSSAKREAAPSSAQAPAPMVPADEAPPPVAAAPVEVAPAAPQAQGPAASAAPQSPLALNAPPRPAAPPRAEGKAKKSADSPDDPFSDAQALYYENRCAEALPKFQALAPTNPHAELFAARCVARLQGCEAARAKFDAIERAHPGTDVARRAAAESSRCSAAKPSATTNAR